MKKLLIPAVIAVVAGLCGGSGFAYMNAKEAAKVLAAHVADSVAKHVADSTTVADSVAKVERARAMAAELEEVPLTPADSIRLARSQPTSLAAATQHLGNAADAKHPAPAPTKSTPGSSSEAAAVVPKSAAPVPAVATKTAAPTATVRTEPKAPAALENALPERRISKIFGAMQSKDAAKVLEQMTDSDIRVILGMMGDKQAAAILTALPAARAAAISKAELNRNAQGKDEKKPAGEHP
ncbi:MAG: hypothetical protein H7Z40_16780 [Phycisphaerae bacterium]|nr:hypothetical protein [Gemmatimonadaceae bacterium]